MAITNFTEDGEHEDIICSAELNEALHNQLIYFSVVNIFLSITAFLGNALILVALQKDSSLHPPSKLLFRNLATTDLCVGIIAEPLNVAYLMSVVNEQWNTCRFVFVSSHITGVIVTAVSLLTLTVISVDRLLALLLGLRYRQVVTLKRTYLTVTVLWVVSIVATSMHFLNVLITIWCAYIAISLCLIISIVSYTKIFVTLRHYQIQVHDNTHQEQPSQANPLNIARYRKAVSSALWVQMALVVCYLPEGIVRALFTYQEGLVSSLFVAKVLTTTLVYLNSSLNPILYCWKVKEVRQAVKETIRQLWFSSS